MVTIYDVAKRAGMSAATVSRALNGNPKVDPVLAARARAAAVELSYQPNAVARSFRRQKSALWMLLISDIENPFFTAVARGVEDVAQASGYSLALCNSDESLEKERRYITGALNERVSGVLIAPAGAETDVAPLLQRGVPVVAFDRMLRSGEFDSVVTASRLGAFEATAHLLQQGWSSVACISGPLNAATAGERTAGYVEAMTERSVRSPVVVHSDFKPEGGRLAARELLDGPEPPDALLVANSSMALGVLAELDARWLVPGIDVGIVCFDDPPWAALLKPPLSTVAQPAYELGQIAARLLHERASGHEPGAARHETLPCQMVIRGSSLHPVGPTPASRP